MEQYLRFIWLVPLGFFAGAYGTLIGAGGGFILVPVLLLFYPGEATETITSISLAVVFFNALSGSLAYARTKRIDYKSGTIFALAAVPGAVLGALGTTYVPRRHFDALFGILMLLVSALLFVRPATRRRALEKRIPSFTKRTLEGNRLARLVPPRLLLGIGLSSGLGYISSFLGIGAGFIYVPAFVYLLDFPVHTATATSLFILTIMSFTGSATHIVAGLFHEGIRRTVALVLGVILGAQLGAWFSRRVHGDWIIRGLAVALSLAGIRLLMMAWP
ncbi:MAG: sulfite exporter TauE/SafE family protein [Deltaproteobacteria bacterium]|nr:sulfite exporter TauE/SafE family protein [Deltaproteobacteria bacterium]